MSQTTEETRSATNRKGQYPCCHVCGCHNKLSSLSRCGQVENHRISPPPLRKLISVVKGIYVREYSLMNLTIVLFLDRYVFGFLFYTLPARKYEDDIYVWLFYTRPFLTFVVFGFVFFLLDAYIYLLYCAALQLPGR